MSVLSNKASETQTSSAALDVLNDVSAFVGLLVLGFPITPGVAATTVVSGIMVAVTLKQSVLEYFTPNLQFEENRR